MPRHRTLLQRFRDAEWPRRQTENKLIMLALLVLCGLLTGIASCFGLLR